MPDDDGGMPGASLLPASAPGVLLLYEYGLQTGRTAAGESVPYETAAAWVGVTRRAG